MALFLRCYYLDLRALIFPQSPEAQKSLSEYFFSLEEKHILWRECQRQYPLS